MKKNNLGLVLLFLLISNSCIGQSKKIEFDTFVQKYFKLIELPVKSDTLKPGKGSITYEEIKTFLSSKPSAFYGKVDWEGYASYKYFSPSWVLKRNSNVKCLIYGARRFGGQSILSTYDDNGNLIDTLVIIQGIDLGPDHGLRQVYTIGKDYKIKVIKQTDECIRSPKYIKEKGTWVESLYRGQVDTIYYSIDENGRFRHLSTITRKDLLFMDSKAGKVEVDSVKAGLNSK